MREISEANFAAMQAGRVIARDFVWFVVRNRETGAPVTDGYWSDVGTRAFEVIDPESGAVVQRTWYGAAGLISISDIPLVSTITVQTVIITLSQASDRINELLRAYDCKQGGVQIFRGHFNLETRELVSPAMSRFVGFIDKAPVTTPKENEVGDVKLTCISHTQEMTRASADTRSDASQRLRSATDNFYQDTPVVSSWEQRWGLSGGPIRTGANGDKGERR